MRLHLPRTHAHTATTAATVESLAAPSGAVPNHDLARAAAQQATRSPAPRASTVTVKQPAAHGWRCDACRRSGYGGLALLDHAGRTGHRRYSMTGA